MVSHKMILFVCLFVCFFKVAALTIKVGNYSNEVSRMTDQSGLLVLLSWVILVCLSLYRRYYIVAMKYGNPIDR